ncbi:MAG: hypothetical protein BGO88_04915 [Flavobacterium sp. 38-13]|uniref:hypothetical protein n=1 Tax=Flavobacterium sp. 38-13 TaxID=1896168 RepID=UPI000962E8B2|nr:hypothetical protein [Flavobacterium sp. 38-13]OJX55558.1 MAG: hypothetical protein BGO88_04915 [Flavobacterium sp. 38-13]
MKRIILKTAKFFYYLRNYFKIKKYSEINQKLDSALREREVNKVILKGNIIKMVKSYLRTDADSKYIPKERRNNTEIKQRVLAEFGVSMEELGVKINDELELI